MGIFWSRTKIKKGSKEILEDLETQIVEAKRKRQRNLNSEKSFTVFLLLASCVIYLIALVLFYFYFIPTTLLERFVNTSPLVVFPFVIYAVKRLMGSLFAQRKEKIDNVLKDLFTEKNKILDEVKEKEPYKVAMEILEKYDPRQAVVQQQHPMPKGPGGGLRLRQSAVKPSGASLSPMPSQPAGKQAGVPPHPVPGSPAPQLNKEPSQSLLSPSSSTEGVIPPGMGVGSAPGPPLPLRNVVPQERSTFDKFLDYVVGDGPGQRYALICCTCFAHNGMALKDEFEYITFRCAYCFHLNPARKRRESAPKLMKTPSMDKLERPPFSPLQETNENQENTTRSSTSSPVSPVNETPSQGLDQLPTSDQVEEKGSDTVKDQPTFT